ncbi:MAG: hypothetical protein LBC18_11435 [Opitutaceae bacterium]|jgi:hypothetical protein|nr:hypothetical protein [Opitutaceae bacterium]
MTLLRLALLSTALFAVTTANCPAAGPQPLAPRHWLANPLHWRFSDDGASCPEPAAAAAGDFAVFEGAPASGEVAVEAVLTPRETGGKGWRVAGIAIVDDSQNYWQLALVAPPDGDTSRHGFELGGRRDGAASAEKKLDAAPGGQAAARPWRFGRPLRFSLRMTPEGVTGEVSDTSGGLLYKRGFLFSAPAIRRGRPALHARNFACDFTELRAAWAATGGPPSQAVTPFAPGGPPLPGATGFFRTEKQPDGSWRILDPLGRPARLLGVDIPTFNGFWCAALGYSPYQRLNEKKYAGREDWNAETLARLREWGFTALGTRPDPGLLRRGFPHYKNLAIGLGFASAGGDCEIAPHEGKPSSAFPNVFSPGFEKYARFVARRECATSRDDPWLAGYFIDNELAWWGRDKNSRDTGLFDAVLKKPAAHSAKRALRDFLKKLAGGSLPRLNVLFGTRLKSFDDILTLDTLPHATPGQAAAKRVFLALAAETYFAVTTRAIRDADPNHSICGARYAGIHPALDILWEVAGRHCEIISVNLYAHADLATGGLRLSRERSAEPLADALRARHKIAGRPILITEWSFPALDSGLPCTRGAGQRFHTQAERARASELFARTLLSLPFVAGYNYFMWVDEPELGITPAFPENSNYGLVNVRGEPYAALTQMFASLHREAAAGAVKPPPAAAAGPPPARAEEILQRLLKLPAGNAAALEIEPADPGPADGSMASLALAGAGKVNGRYTTLLQVVGSDGRHAWPSISRISASSEKNTPGGGKILTVTASGAAAATTFEVTHRFHTAPGRPWLVAEAVSVKNTGNRPLRLRGVYLQLFAGFKPALAGGHVQNLYGAPSTGCWLAPSGSFFLAALAPSDSDMSLVFYLDKNGRQSPDARLLTETDLAPGETFAPEAPPCLVITAGQDWPAVKKLLAPVL